MRARIREAIRRQTVQPDARKVKRDWPFIRSLHPKQRAFRDDPSKLKIARTSRRAGKSTVAAAMLLEEAGDNPDTMSVYVALTRKSAKRIMWTELKRFNFKYSLGIIFNETELVATLRNGSQIILAAANNEADIERLRGSKYVLVVIDEAGSFGPHLRTLVNDVLEPAMIDHDGTIVMVGTPNASCAGMFFDADTGAIDPATGEPAEAGWSCHHWTVLENPFVPDAKAWLAARCKRRNIDPETDSSYQREWLGLWRRENATLVYKYSDKRNTYLELPKGNFDWMYGLSIDLGYDDPTALVLVQWCAELPDLYVPWMHRQEGMIPATIAAQVKQIQKKHDLSFVVVDQGGGAGKIVTEEFIQRYGIMAKGAEKAKKLTYIEFMNGDLQTGRIKIHAKACAPLIEEMRVLQWDPDRAGKEDERFANDITDAMLYAYREAHHYLFDVDQIPEELVASPGSPAALEEEQRQMEEDAAAEEKMAEWFDP